VSDKTVNPYDFFVKILSIGLLLVQRTPLEEEGSGEGDFTLSRD
jgi:hypothetical protein